MDDGLETEFVTLLTQWEQPEAHRKLLQQLSLRGLLRLGGLRYQKAKLVRPNDPVISAAQQVLLNLAMAGMQRAPAAEASAATSPVRYIIGLLLFSFISLAVGRLACGGGEAVTGSKGISVDG
jgi:hypothetical protein